MMTQGLTLGSSACDRRQFQRLLDRLFHLGASARRTFVPDRDRAPAVDAVTIPVIEVSETGDEDTCPSPPRTSTALSYLVVGTPEDRAAFTTAVRAFALAGRWGDRLTLVGYGSHRRRLEKWTHALRIEGTVSFADPDDPDAASVVRHDVAILVSRQRHQVAMLLHALLDGQRVLAIRENAAASDLLHDGALGMLFPAHDVSALCHTMLAVAVPDPAVVKRRLAPYVVCGASSEPSVRLKG